MSITAAYQMLLSRDKGAGSSQTGTRKGHHNNNGGGRSGGRGNGSGGGCAPHGQGQGQGQEQGRRMQSPPATVTPRKNFTQATYSMAQMPMHFPDGIPNHYVVLDSNSSVSIFNNAAMLVDIHNVETPLVLESNGGGHQVTHQMGTIPDFGKVWLNENSIANVLLLANVRKAHHGQRRRPS
jgi:hypothetical protein